MDNKKHGSDQTKPYIYIYIYTYVRVCKARKPKEAKETGKTIGIKRGMIKETNRIQKETKEPNRENSQKKSSQHDKQTKQNQRNQ